MKIGILTFHWAPNYGAVMQCYALQRYLEQCGHTVHIINYKPRQNDDNLYNFFKLRKFLYLKEYSENKKKDNALQIFRNNKLNLTDRVYTYLEIPQIISNYDAIISGSDQVLNPHFLLNGEKQGVISPTYFLGFPFYGRKIGYALSFGCVSYPQTALSIASEYIKDFDYLSTREATGTNILSSMGREDNTVVPDPTLLQPSTFYCDLITEKKMNTNISKIYCFFIRNISERKTAINSILSNNKIIWNNDDKDYSIQGWLAKIKQSKLVITDSFHCMVMCLKFHTPFIVVTELKGNIGMNDRFYTLLAKMSLSHVLLHKDDISLLSNFSNITFDWNKVDSVLDDYFYVGKRFLDMALHQQI